MATLLRDTADIRAKLLNIWKLVEERKISPAEARLHIGLARAVLATLAVEISAAHLARLDVPSVSLGRGPETITFTPKRPTKDS